MDQKRRSRGNGSSSLGRVTSCRDVDVYGLGGDNVSRCVRVLVIFEIRMLNTSRGGR
jgi:hypothetical protein